MRLDHGDHFGGGILALLDAGNAIGQAIPMPRIGADPPRQFQLFKWGVNKTTKGPLRLTRKGAAQVMADYQARGHTLCFDLWHSTFDKALKPEDKFAVGHYRIELRGDPNDGNPLSGLWAADIQWVEPYGQQIRAGKWPFVSPSPLHTADGEIVGIKNSALVTDPATLGAQPTILTALSGGNMDPKKRFLADMYDAGEAMMRHGQKLAETDGPERTMAQSMLAAMAPHMDQMKACLGDDMGPMQSEMADKRAKVRKGEEVLSALTAAYEVKDLTQLQDRILDDRLASVGRGNAEESERQTLLSDARIPPGQLGIFKAMSLPALRSRVGSLAAPVALPTAPTKETKPADPTTATVTHLSDTKPEDKPAPILTTLSDQDRHVMQVAGMTEEQMRASKAALARTGITNLLSERSDR